ncbi:MAG: hypothetical protein IPJ82_05670 [Lewinellaceae bacterium]|nr:hypothetical protein [Lewinellaceae bacterium]
MSAFPAPLYNMLAILYAQTLGPIPVNQTAGLPSGAEFPIGTDDELLRPRTV